MVPVPFEKQTALSCRSGRVKAGDDAAIVAHHLEPLGDAQTAVREHHVASDRSQRVVRGGGDRRPEKRPGRGRPPSEFGLHAVCIRFHIARGRSDGALAQGPIVGKSACSLDDDTIVREERAVKNHTHSFRSPS